MLFSVLVLVAAIWTTGQGLLPDLNVTECTTTHLDITLWQTTPSTSAEAACISENATCVTGKRYIPFDDDFNEVIGQFITISLTEKEGQCQNVDEGVCTILFVSTKYNGMKFTARHVCTLSTSEAVSSTTSSQVPSGAKSPALISNTVVISVTVATGLLLLLCFVTFGGLFLINYSSCRHTQTRMRDTLQIEHVVKTAGPNVLTGSLNDVISCDCVTVYDQIQESELESMDDTNEEVKYVHFVKSDNVDRCSYPTDCGQDTPPEQGLIEYIALEPSTP